MFFHVFFLCLAKRKEIYKMLHIDLHTEILFDVSVDIKIEIKTMFLNCIYNLMNQFL